MNGLTKETDRDPFYLAICDAVNYHPAITGTPQKMRSARASLLIAQARTLASMTTRPHTCLRQDAGQMVDDAALLLGYQQQRANPVILSTYSSNVSSEFEKEISGEPLMIIIGLSTAESFARFKDALMRTTLISLSNASDASSYEASAKRAIREMIHLVLKRRVRIDLIEDEDLIEITQDIITKIAATDGKS